MLAPVDQHTTTYDWPATPVPQNTALPLFPSQPQSLDARFDCGQPRDGLVLGSTPPGDLTGDQLGSPELTVRAEKGTVSVRLASTTLVERPLAPSCSWRILVDASGTSVELDGTRVAHDDRRPVVSGLYTDSKSPNLEVRVVADTRFDTDASGLKIALGIIAGLSLLALLVLIRRWDAWFTRRVRLLPKRFFAPRLTDLVVTAVLAIWAFIGPLTVDDGYIITMLKARDDSGFVGNYFRWFNAPEAPFGWFYEPYHWLASISANELWMRLPAVGLGLLSWALIDRLLLPRLTSGARTRTRWACAALFLLWYLPYDVGIRPEPLIVLGSLVVFVLVERALGTGAVGPLAVGIVVAGATLAVTPTGIVAFLPFVAGLPGIVRLLRRRRDLSWLVLVMLLLATGGSAMLLMFYDQTLSTVLEATRVRTKIGPSYEWQREIDRYRTLLDPTVVEGALNRRVPMLLTLFSMTALGALLLNRRTPGLATGATRRLILATALYLVALMFTPTKWTHHFGALAGFGVLVIAVLVHTVGKGALRSVWARAVSMAILAAVVALALSAPDRWWYVSGYGLRWGGENPSIAGFSVANLTLAFGVLVAVVGGVVGAWRTAGGRFAGERDLRWLPPVSLLMIVVSLATVVVEVGSLGEAVARRWDTYTIGKSNLTDVGGCGLEDWLGVEADVGAGVLHAEPGSAARLGTFALNGGFPASSKPEAPYGSDPAHPVWGSDKAATGSMTSSWFTLPPSASSASAPPLVVARAGTGNVHVKLEFAKAGEVVRSVDVPAATDGSWKDFRFDAAQVAGASQVRVAASDDDGDGWVAVSAPRLPVTVPTTQLVPVGEPVAVDWPNAFVLPCRKPASLANGMVEPVRYRFAPGTDAELAGLSYDAGAGGPFAPVVQLAKQHVVPTYLRGDKLREPVTVMRFDYPTPMRGLRVTHGEHPVSGFARDLPHMN